MLNFSPICQQVRGLFFYALAEALFTTIRSCFFTASLLLSDSKLMKCECTSSAFVAGDVAALEFLWPGPAPRGGQFFLLKPQRTGVFLGRPISAAGWKPKNAAKPLSGGIVSFLVLRRGRGSRELMDMRPGEEAELLGPLGNTWAQMDSNADTSPIALVSGGVGIAPLLLYACELGKRPFDFYAGFRTGSFGLEKIKPRSLTIATEDGSQGLKGRIPDFFTPSGYRAVFACGPEPMLKIVGDACIASEIPCYVSLEKHMACGVGACLGCTVKITGGNRLCCKDGPIFNVEEVCFDH